MLPRLRTWLPILSLAAAATLLPGCDDKEEQIPSIANIAVANADFSVLEDAAVRGGVVGVLSNRNPNDPQGNYTVFAPTNAAFARLGLRSAPDLLVLNREFLTNTLLYHVTGGNIAGSSLVPGFLTPSALGPARRIFSRGGGALYVNGSRILQTDVRASNGTVHVIDKVLLASGKNVVATAIDLTQAKVFVQPELTFLVEAVLFARLEGPLQDLERLTVFAPNDQAFRDLLTQLRVQPGGPGGTFVPADIRKLPQTTVQDVLLQHVIQAPANSVARFTSQLPENAASTSLLGTPITFGAFTDGVLTVRANGNGPNVANMVIPDVQCTNGIVHVIDRVLLP